MNSSKKYVAFLRGINVGGRHKVPMAILKEALEKINLQKVSTVLNSGNILFETNRTNLEEILSNHLENVFGFPIPTIVCEHQEIMELIENNPFKDLTATKDTRWYVSFLKTEVNPEITLPLTSSDGSYTIIEKRKQTIISVLDLAISQTPKAMDLLEKTYGKEITTRNWNTIERIGKKGRLTESDSLGNIS